MKKDSLQVETMSARKSRAKPVTKIPTPPRGTDKNVTSRERSLREREAAISRREQGAGGDHITERENAVAVREEAVLSLEHAARLREDAVRADEEAIESKADREELIVQMRGVNERLVVATVRAQTMTEEAEEANRRLEYLVDHDFLTALFNRRRFEQALAQETKSVARYGGGGAVLLLDLDHFKEVNDRFGHKAGDDLLKTVAATLRERIRETDILARLGADEFGIILRQADEDQAQLVAEEVVKALRRQTAMLAEQVLPVTASIGVALFDHLTDIEVLACADLAMYEAKEGGRDRFALYRSAKDAQPRGSTRLAAAERIRDALVHDQFVLYCQPILDLENSEVSQYELLIRLRDEQGELLPPSAFLHVAERFGMIQAIDSWVVQKAVELIADQTRVGRLLTLNVNISAKSIGDAQLINLIGRTLDEGDVDPSHLVFELTETAAVSNIEHASTFTTQLRNRGCKVALDDFGTGFGSFYYLKYLPFDYLKIDGDFIRGFTTDATDQLVVEAIVGIARGMGKKTVAEFVTDMEMTDRLRRSGVDYAQGYHIGAPRPVSDMVAEL